MAPRLVTIAIFTTVIIPCIHGTNSICEDYYYETSNDDVQHSECNVNEPWLCEEYHESHACIENVCFFNEFAFMA